MMYIVIIKIYF